MVAESASLLEHCDWDGENHETGQADALRRRNKMRYMMMRR